ncbi:MAG: hypothetical protein ABS920_13025 [Sporosarcina sp.]
MVTVDERQELYTGIQSLREKQVTKGLSADEEQTLLTLLKQMDEYIEKVHKRQVNYNEEQMKAPIKVAAFRNATFIESPVKQSMVERLLKKEQIVYYDLQVNSWDDVNTFEWSFRFIVEVKKFVEKIGLGSKWSILLPAAMEMSPVDSLDKAEAEWLNLLPDPKWCLAAFNEVDALEGLAKQHSEEMHECIIWLKEQWEGGYQIYMDFSELKFIQI